MKAKLGIDIPQLVDADLSVIKSYGILNEKAGDIPHPTALIIDKDGKIAYLHAEVDYSVRPEPEEMIAVLKKLQAETSAADTQEPSADEATTAAE